MNLITQLPQPVIFAHRGACAHAPENTLASFRLACQVGAPAIELDAKLSADGQVVVIHDPTVDRTTDGHGKVAEMTLAQLKELNAAHKFNDRYSGEPIPTLEEVFEEFGSQLYINVELTNYTSPRDQLVEKVAALVKRFNLVDRVIFSSFHPMNLRQIRQLLPDAQVGILALEGEKGKMARGWVGRMFSPHVVHPFLKDVDDAFLKAQHSRGRRVHVWTVNEPEDLRRLFRLGVDGVFTDDPKLAAEVLRSV